MDQPLETLLRVGAPAGLIAGALSGVLARVAMRAFALAGGEKPTFSVSGTLGIIVIYALVFGLPLGLIYFRFWRPQGWAGDWNGLAFGALLLLILIVIPFLLIPSDEATLALRLTAIGVFVPVPLVFGLAVGYLAERLMPSVLA